MKPLAALLVALLPMAAPAQSCEPATVFVLGLNPDVDFRAAPSREQLFTALSGAIRSGSSSDAFIVKRITAPSVCNSRPAERYAAYPPSVAVIVRDHGRQTTDYSLSASESATLASLGVVYVYPHCAPDREAESVEVVPAHVFNHERPPATRLADKTGEP